MTTEKWADWTPDKNEKLFTSTEQPTTNPDATAAGSEEATAKARKFKRLPRQSDYRPPAGAKPFDPSNWGGNMRSVVPVSSVARDWGISPRRVRTMLTEGRLEGRQLENGYWEVYFPYRYVFGTRGPAIKRQRDLPVKPPKKQDWMKEW